MLSFNKNKDVFFIMVFIILFTVGIALHLIPFTQKYILPLTDLFLLTANSVVLYLVFREQKDKKLITWCIIAFLFTYFIEFAGVRSGKIFGDYHYGKTMFIQILDVPVVIGMNWVILILAGYSIAVWTKAKTILIPILSSVLIVGFDFIMENVAIKLDYWQWKDNTVPLQNYFAWFIISLIFSSNLVLMKVRVNNRVIKFYFIIQLLFFIALRLLLP